MSLPYKPADFWFPESNIVVDELLTGLRVYFASVNVSVVKCSDLIGFSTMWTGDPTPEEIYYVGYFNHAKSIYRFGDIYEELGLKP